MTLREGLALALLGFLMVVAGAVWLVGPWGLLAGGILLTLVVVVFVDIAPAREREREE